MLNWDYTWPFWEVKYDLKHAPFWIYISPSLKLTVKTPENGSLEYDCFLKRGSGPFFWGLLLLVSGRVLPRYIWIKVSPIRDPYKPTIVECKPSILLATYLASEPRSRRWTVASTPWHVLEKLIVKQIRRYQVYTPWKLTWNLKMMVSNRNLLFQGFIFRFHVSFPGCKPRINGLMING